MLIPRYLRNEYVCMSMETGPLDDDEVDALGASATRVLKERILGEIVEFLSDSDAVGNPKRLLTDMINRERKACTAVGGGLAIPHVRTLNVKKALVALFRSQVGLEFEAPDQMPVHIFLVLLAPPYDDRHYLKIYREVGELFLREDTLMRLLRAETPSEIMNYFRSPEREDR